MTKIELYRNVDLWYKKIGPNQYRIQLHNKSTNTTKLIAEAVPYDHLLKVLLRSKAKSMKAH